MKGVAFGCCALLALACGGSDGATPGAGGSASNSPTAMTWSDYFSTVIDRWCTQILTCPYPNDDQLGARAVLRTPERCRAHYEAVWSRSNYWRDFTESGRIVLDVEKANACFALGVQCASDTICTEALVGTVPVGAQCFRNEDCVAGAYCAGELASCPGVCTAKKSPGEPCEWDSECSGATGTARCNTSVDPWVCEVHPIRGGATLGQPCGIVPSGDRVWCTDELWCDGPFDGQGTCAAPIPIGQACDDGDLPCAGLGFCGADNVNATCQEVSISQVGGPCDTAGGITAQVCDPLANLICVAGQCELAGDGGDGSRCVSGDLGDASCQVGYYCDWDTDTCLPFKTAGAQCSSSQECAVSCNFETNLCSDQYCGL